MTRKKPDFIILKEPEKVVPKKQKMDELTFLLICIWAFLIGFVIMRIIAIPLTPEQVLLQDLNTSKELYCQEIGYKKLYMRDFCYNDSETNILIKQSNYNIWVYEKEQEVLIAKNYTAKRFIWI